MGYIMDLREIVGTRPLMMPGANVIVLDSEDKILLQLRTDNHCWGLPGGSLELGESLEQVAKRELFEECGLVAKRLTLFNVFSGEEFYYRYPNGDQVYNVIATYICTDYGATLKADNEEVQALKFFSIEELPKNINPPEVRIIEEFLNQIWNNFCY